MGNITLKPIDKSKEIRYNNNMKVYTTQEAMALIPSMTKAHFYMLRERLKGKRKLAHGKIPEDLFVAMKKAFEGGFSLFAEMQSDIEKRTGMNYRKFLRYKKKFGIKTAVERMSEREFVLIRKGYDMVVRQRVRNSEAKALCEELGVTDQQYSKIYTRYKQAHPDIPKEKLQEAVFKHVRMLKAGSPAYRMVDRNYVSKVPLEWYDKNMPNFRPSRRFITKEKAFDYLKFFKRSRLNTEHPIVKEFIAKYPSHEGEI